MKKKCLLTLGSLLFVFNLAAQVRLTTAGPWDVRFGFNQSVINVLQQHGSRFLPAFISKYGGEGFVVDVNDCTICYIPPEYAASRNMAVVEPTTVPIDQKTCSALAELIYLVVHTSSPQSREDVLDATYDFFFADGLSAFSWDPSRDDSMDRLIKLCQLICANLRNCDIHWGPEIFMEATDLTAKYKRLLNIEVWQKHTSEGDMICVGGLNSYYYVLAETTSRFDFEKHTPILEEGKRLRVDVGRIDIKLRPLLLA